MPNLMRYSFYVDTDVMDELRVLDPGINLSGVVRRLLSEEADRLRTAKTGPLRRKPPQRYRIRLRRMILPLKRRLW